MKILMVGVFNENSTNNGIANGFERAGHEVERYDYRERAKIFGNEERDNELLYNAKVNWYNLVFFCKCNGMDVGVVRRFSDFDNCKTFLWYMDPLNGNYNAELIEKMKAADHVGVAKWEVYLAAKQHNPNTHFLIEGFDPDWDYPIDTPKKYDASFIGSPYGDRESWLGGVTLLSNKFNVEHSRAVGETKVNINLTGGGGPSDRVYKILAAGGFCLSQYYPHMVKYGLEPGKDLVFASNPKDMAQKIFMYANDRHGRERIAAHGHETVQKFSRDNLARQIIDIVNK